MELEDIRLQVGWVYVGAWWGQKAEMLKKCVFLKLFVDENWLGRVGAESGSPTWIDTWICTAGRI